MALPRTKLGRTGLEVTRLGYGAMELRGGGPVGRALDSSDAGRLLNAVLDGGINYIDTSPDYGHSEELIGEHISHRRDEYVLASKCGCPINQPRPPRGQRPEHVFTAENIRAGVEQSLSRMKTDHLDVVQFHASPSRAVLEESESVETLRELQREGKIRFLGMSGTLPHLTDHIAMDVFDAFQIPYSAVEREHDASITAAAQAGAGTVIRGGVARGAPDESKDLETYPELWRSMMEKRRDAWNASEMDALLDGISRMEFMLRYTLSHPQMHTTIVGTMNPAHLADNLTAAQNGPLPDDLYQEARRRLEAVAQG